MAIKTIQQILPPPPAHFVGDGFRVHNFFPNGYNMPQDRMSPFYLLDYNSRINFSARENPRGVGVHPHRGFETVTIAYRGKVQHHDSRGNSGIIGPGDIQWMTAGAGVLHKEYHAPEYSRVGGEFQMVQLWVNLPAKFKMTTPKYQAIENRSIPKVKLPEGLGVVEVIAGEFQGIKGIATTFSEIEMYNIILSESGQLIFELPNNFNTGILVIEGSVNVNDSEEAPVDNFILFRNDGEEISLSTKEGAQVLVLSGKPLKEPIVGYGPFLMNTKDEIIQAYKDLNTGKLGHLED